MRTMLRSKVTLLFIMVAALIAVPAVVALADVVQNNIDTSIDATAETRSISTDGSTTVGYTLQVANNNNTYPDSNGCNTGAGNPITVNINTPQGVTASPNSLTFTSCGTTQNVTFTSSKATPVGSPYNITVTASGGAAGTTTYTDPATWALTVNKAQPTISAVSGTGNAGSSNGSLTATLKNATVTPNKNLSGKDITFAIGGNNVPGTATTNGSGVATLNNVDLSGVTQGTKSLTANFAGDGDYLAATGSGSLVVGAPLCTATTSVTTQPQDANITYGTDATFTADANGTNPTVQWQVLVTGSGATWTDINGATSKTLTVSNPAVADSGKQYRAVFSNTCNGSNSATSNAATLTVGKATANVALSGLGPYTYDGTAKSASATTSNPSGLNVSITYSQGPNSVTNPTDAGPYAVVATINDANYKGSASSTLTIGQAASSVQVDCPASPVTYTGSALEPCTAHATGAGGLNQALTVSYTDNTNVGTAHASASYAGDANHTGNTGSATFTIQKANQTITFGTIANKVVGANFTVSATASSGLPVSFAASGSCTVSGTNVSVTGVGPCTITASQVGNGNYNAAPPVPQSFNGSYTFFGWLQPVDGDGTATGAVNLGKVGRTYPIKWQLKDATGALISDAAAQALVSSMSGSAKNVTCGSWNSLGSDVLEDYTTGNTTLRYDDVSDQFIYNYKAPSSAVCQAFVISKADGVNSKQANFNFQK